MAMLRSKKKGASTAKDKKEDCKCKDKKEKCTCKDKKKAKKSVTENTVFSFKQFINESEDFQNKFDPSNFENEDKESEINSMGSDDDDDSDEQEHSDDELMDAHDGSGKDEFGEEDFDDDDSDFEDTGDSGLGDTTSSKSGGSKVDKINNELMDVNNEIGRMLDQYTSDRDIATYKKNASPLLAKRKELQAKLDSAFNIGVGQDTGEDLEMQDDTYQF